MTGLSTGTRGSIASAERGGPGEAYNLGNPDNECTILDLAREVCKVLGVPRRIRHVDPRDLWGPGFAEAPDKVPDASKARNILKWVPTRSRRQVIEDAAA